MPPTLLLMLTWETNHLWLDNTFARPVIPAKAGIHKRRGEPRYSGMTPPTDQCGLESSVSISKPI